MQPDMTRRLRRRAAELGQLARDLVAATPQRCEGSDATGSVRIVLGPDGLPIQVRVRDGWQQRLLPEHLGAAVVQANTDAVQRAMRVWTDRLDDSRWWRRRAEVDEMAGEAPGRALGDLPDVPSGQPRDSTELAEQVLAALQVVQRQPTAAPPPDVGTDDAGRVSVQVGAGGLSSCVIDAGWAGRRDGATISAAVSSALQRAVAQRPVVSSPGAGIDNVVGDGLATLGCLTMPIDRGGDR